MRLLQSEAARPSSSQSAGPGTACPGGARRSCCSRCSPSSIWYPDHDSTAYWQSVLFFPVGVYILLALGLNIVVGQTGLLDLGYVAFFAVGAYTTAKLTADDGAFNAWEALLLAILVAMVAGVMLGGPTLRLRGDYLAIVTLGFGEIVRIIAQNSGSLGEARGITGIPHPSTLPGARVRHRTAALLLPGARLRSSLAILVSRAAQAFARRPGVGGHPGGRGRGRARWACRPSR